MHPKTRLRADREACPGLGTLAWDEDTTCWKGNFPGPPHKVEIYVGLGERDTVPPSHLSSPCEMSTCILISRKVCKERICASFALALL